MSGIKPVALTEFYRSLRARGVTTDTLAAELHVSGAVVRKLIGGLKRRKGRVWEALFDLLNDKEKALLRTVEQCSAWNISQARKRPVWTAAKVHDLFETYGHETLRTERDRLVSSAEA